MTGFCSAFSLTAYRGALAFRAYSHVHLFLWAGLCLLYGFSLCLWQPRRGRFALAGGLIFGICQPLGEVLNASGILSQMVPLVPGYVVFYAAWVNLILAALDSQKRDPLGLAAGAEQTPVQSGQSPANGFGARLVELFKNLLSGQKKQTLWVFGILALCWLPSWILFWPGLVSADVGAQMAMGLGTAVMTSHHPPLHSWWLGGCMELGQKLFGNYATGVAMASLGQMLCMAAILAFTLWYMAKLQVAFPYRLAAFLLYALSPAYSLFSITLWKDVWLGCFTLLFLLVAVDITQNRRAFFASPVKIVALALACAGVVISKNSGIYLLVIALFAMVVFLKGCRVQVLAVLAGCVLFTAVLEGPVYDALWVEKGDVREALSIPMMQMAMVVRDAPETLSPEDEAMLRAILPYDYMDVLYDFRVVDAVKSEFKSDVFMADLGGYIKLWARLGLSHPNLYLRSFLELSCGYFYPDTVAGVFTLTPYTTYIRENNIDFYGVELMSGQYSEWNLPFVDFARTHVGVERNVPGFAMLFSVGFHFWVLVFCCIYSMYKKDRFKLVPMALLFAVWLTCLASPVYSEFRYAFGAVLAVPFMAGYMLASPRALPKAGAGKAEDANEAPKAAPQNSTGI